MSWLRFYGTIRSKRIVKKEFMKKIVLFLLFVISVNHITCSEVTDFTKIKTEEVSDLFKTNLDIYIQRAKELARKKMSQDEINELTEKAISIIDDMKNRYINEKLKTQIIVLKYLNGKDFPDVNEHTNNSEPNQKIILFTIAGYNIFKILTKDVVTKIIEKTPLEIVPIIKELSVFLQFVSANPSDFGHGVFSEKQNEAVTIFATNDAILRIMKVLVYKNLLRNDKVYKMSRLGTYFCQHINENITEAQINEFVSTLKRNTADDTRIAIYIPGTMLDATLKTDTPNDLQSTVSNYIKEINLLKHSNDIANQQLHKNKALEYAKKLLGIIPNTKISTFPKIVELCKILEQKREPLYKDANFGDKKTSLKAKRDIVNYEQMEDLLKCLSMLLDELYSDPKLIELIVDKIPEYVPKMGDEITFFLRELEIINSANNVEMLVSKNREFVMKTDDGTYLLSPLVSIAMEAVKNKQNVSYKKILTDTASFTGEMQKYLAIK